MRGAQWIGLVGLWFSFGIGVAEASPGTDGLAALRLELARDGLSAPRAELDARYAAACAAGWKPACTPTAWRPGGGADLAAAGKALGPTCDSGDHAACTVVGWAADAVGRATNDATSYRRAALLWKVACEDGDVTAACHEYAGMLYESRGISADPMAGVMRWQASCAAGDGASCAALADLYRTGSPTVKANATEAAKYAKSGCDAGSPLACAALDRVTPPADPAPGMSTRCTQGLVADCVTLSGEGWVAADSAAFAWLGRACDLGDGASCARAADSLTRAGDPKGAMTRWEQGCAADDGASCSALAKDLGGDPTALAEHADAFRRSCLVGDDLTACARLGLALQTGTGMPKDPAGALELLSHACSETAGVEACAALGLGFESKALGERDRTSSVKYYGYACDQLDLPSCERRADLIVEGVGVKRDDKEALESYLFACDRGLGSACVKGANLLDDATQLPRDPGLALELDLKGCDGGSALACYRAGQLHEEGFDGSPDYDAARAAYQKAVDADLLEAHAALARLMWRGQGGPMQKLGAKKLCDEACTEGDRRACQGPRALSRVE